MQLTRNNSSNDASSCSALIKGKVKHDLTANYFKTKSCGLVVILAEAWTTQETTAKSGVPLVQLLCVQELSPVPSVPS